MRDQIEALLGPAAVKEISAWNDGVPEPLSDYAVPMSDHEADLQELSLMSLPHDRSAMWDHP